MPGNGWEINEILFFDAARHIIRALNALTENLPCDGLFCRFWF